MTPDERRERRRRERRRRILRRRLAALAVVGAAGAAVLALAVGGGDPAPPTADASPSPATAPAAPAAARTLPVVVPGPGAATRTVRLSLVGDIVMGTPEYGLPPNGGRDLLDPVAPLLVGDVVVGNLEGTLTSRGTSKCGAGGSPNCFAFRTPPSYAAHLRDAGFTVMNLANNHSNDFGPVGVTDTVAALRRAGLRETGRPGRFTVVTTDDGVRVAVLGFAPYSWANRVEDLPAVRRLVRRAAGRADLVVVTMHGGAEGSDRTRQRPGTEFYLGENRGDLMAFARAAIDSGADLVVGHGPHVLRGMEFYRGRLIAYSMGNFTGYEAFSLGGPLGVSGVLQVTLRGDGRWVTGRFRPTYMIPPGSPAPGGSGVSIVAALSRQDFGSRAARVAGDGTIRRPAAR